jgi:hypothetical protein
MQASGFSKVPIVRLWRVLLRMKRADFIVDIVAGGYYALSEFIGYKPL